jgi:hypothetical protein
MIASLSDKIEHKAGFLSDLRIRTVIAAQGGFHTVSNIYTWLFEYIIRVLCTQNIYHGLRPISQAGEMFSKVPTVGGLCCGL